MTEQARGHEGKNEMAVPPMKFRAIVSKSTIPDMGDIAWRVYLPEFGETRYGESRDAAILRARQCVLSRFDLQDCIEDTVIWADNAAIVSPEGERNP